MVMLTARIRLLESLRLILKQMDIQILILEDQLLYEMPILPVQILFLEVLT